MHTQCPGSPASKHVCCRSAMITERPQSSVTRKGPTKAACSPKDASTPGSGGASRRKKPRKSRASEEARTRRVKKQMPNPFREHHRRGRAVDMRGVLNCCIVQRSRAGGQSQCLPHAKNVRRSTRHRKRCRDVSSTPASCRSKAMAEAKHV